MIPIRNWLIVLGILFFALTSFAFDWSSIELQYYPSSPNSTSFISGFQKILIISHTDENLLSVQLTSTDFNLFATQSTQSFATTPVFAIQGTTPGTKNYSLTITTENATYVQNYSITIDSQEMVVDGPYVFTDFKFKKTYSTDQNIIFSCWGALNVVVDCLPLGEYRINDGNWVLFTFGEPVLFSFDGNKKVQVHATNYVGTSITKDYYLAIVKTVPPKSFGGGGSIVVASPSVVPDANTPDTNVPPLPAPAPSPDQNSPPAPPTPFPQAPVVISQATTPPVASAPATGFFGLNFDTLASSATPSILFVLILAVALVLSAFFIIRKRGARA